MVKMQPIIQAFEDVIDSKGTKYFAIKMDDGKLERREYMEIFDAIYRGVVVLSEFGQAARASIEAPQ